MLRRIAGEIRKHAEDYSKEVKKQRKHIEDEVKESFNEFDESFIAKVLEEYTQFKEYFTNNGTYMVKNIKNQGFPSADKIYKELERKTKKDIKEIKKELPLDFIEDLVHENIPLALEAFKPIINQDIETLGRSGGYWGFLPQEDMIQFDDKLLNKSIDEALKEYAFKYKKESDVDIDDVILDVIDFVDKDQSKEDLFEISKNWIGKLDRLDQAMNKTIQEFESTKKWVDLIIANNYLG